MSQANQTVEEGGALTVELTVDQDGKPFGKLNGIEIGKAGEVIAHYSNNMMRTLYKIPVATFANANGLTASSGGLYSVSGESGTATLRQAHQNGAGRYSRRNAGNEHHGHQPGVRQHDDGPAGLFGQCPGHVRRQLHVRHADRRCQMSRAMGASSPKDDALLHAVERLEREIASQFRENPDLRASPALRLKLMALMDDLERITRELRIERDALGKEIKGLDGAVIATDAYRIGGRLGQTK